MAYSASIMPARNVALENPVVHAGIKCAIESDGILIDTPDIPWANAVEFSLTPPESFDPSRDGLLVEAELTCLAGDMVIALQGVDDTLIAQQHAEVTHSPTIIRLFAPCGAEPTRILFRNGENGGGRARIGAIRTMTAKAEAAREDSLPVNLWTITIHTAAHAAIMLPRGVSVLTSSAPWAYAATVTLPSISFGENALAALELLIRNVTGRPLLRVIDQTGAVIRDMPIDDAGPSLRTATLVLGTGVLDGSLVISNGPDIGPASLEIEEARAYPIPLDVDDGILNPSLAREPAPNPNWNWYYGDYADGPAETVRAIQFERLQQPTLMRWLDGLQIMIYPQNELSRAIYVSGVYEPDLMLLMRSRLKRGMTAIDIGANIGVLSLYMARLAGPRGRVYAIEASSREFRRLEENVRLNQLINVTPLRGAAGEREGRAVLHLAKDQYAGQNTLGTRFAYENVSADKTETVKVFTIDGFVARNVIKRIDLLKIDVEGAETSVLRGARKTLLRHRPDLIIEVSSASLRANSSSVSELSRVLRELRYEYFMIEANGALTPLAELPDGAATNVFASARPVRSPWRWLAAVLRPGRH